ncbi:UTP--glucose-1-phosphate uridylyltransferase [Pleurocapsales cyanobacterium LEGE 10410]|nr:UTP--glucose-1-phosphate uridylyltransferase [Pleurocapsales cyanobacterium LEGE 10410]
MSTNRKQIRKAVIPAAGFGTRMYPATKALNKELFPIVGKDGRVKPIILAIVEEAISAGIEEVGIVVQPGDRNLFEDLLKSPPKPELWQKLSAQNREYSQYLQSIGDRITILTQAEPEGFGHAVFCSRDWVNNEPFLLLLGDHVYTSELETSCAAQMVEIYRHTAKSVIGVSVMDAEIIHKAGCVGGTWQSESILEIEQIYEKPTLEYARENLQVPGMPDDKFLGVFGMYILESEIFDLLGSEIERNQRFKEEFQLTTCLDKLRTKAGAIAYLVKGQYYDTGMPLFYRQTMIDYYQNS